MPMKLRFSDSATISGDLASVWLTVTDVASWPTWDPHLRAAGMEGAFEPGATGWSRPRWALRGPFKVTGVDPEHGYSTESRMPMGTMYITTRYEQVEPGKVSAFKQFELHGGFVPTFWLLYLRPMKRDLARAFLGLEREALRRAAGRSESR